MPTRVSVYIDGSNLFYGSEMIGVRVDYQKLKAILESKRILVDLNFYNCEGTNLGEKNFHKKLASFGYNLKLFHLRNYGGKRFEKKIDTQIVADSLVDGLVENKFDLVVFGCGDKDILPAVEYLLQRKKLVEIMSFKGTLAWELRTSGAKIVILDQIIAQIRRS